MIGIFVVAVIVAGIGVWEFSSEIERFIDDIRGRGDDDER